ncbi:hypothetical protein FQN57_006200 [Myotisia sp. PD_48]|nr:hypothetical protein FQN57_006200 [Myotisia sp. PD_48]
MAVVNSHPVPQSPTTTTLSEPAAVTYEQSISSDLPAAIVETPSVTLNGDHSNDNNPLNILEKTTSNPNPSPSRPSPLSPNNVPRPTSAWSRFKPSSLSLRGHATATSTSTTRNGSCASPTSPHRIPSIIVDEAPNRPSSRRSEKNWGSLRGKKGGRERKDSVPDVPPLPNIEPFQGITLDIPTPSLGDLTSPSTIEESDESRDGITSIVNSSLLSSKDATHTSPTNFSTRRIRSSNSLRAARVSSVIRTLSVDEELLSRKVRMMYQRGDEAISDAELNQALDQQCKVENGQDLSTSRSQTPNEVLNSDSARSPTTVVASYNSPSNQTFSRESNELAGGVEDWSDIQNGDVDRYGFIVPRRDGGDAQESSNPQPLQRVSTSLMLAAVTPRRKRTLGRNSSTAAASVRSFAGRSTSRKSVEQPRRPTSSQSSYQPTLSRSASSLRYATNRLPHNRRRRLLDEAGDMLTAPHAGQNQDEDSAYARNMRKKEWEREDKWRKMAKLTSKPKDGSGMSFEFDVSSSKLIGRTWKGIPDSWRATAWHAFLSASAKKHEDSPTEEELARIYNELQEESSPDDVQIDIDVPRTISSHIMFRRRYRGGQRLLFRVLHAMSLYFPDTGYVQGMAAIAATLLAYYDEEHAFIMLVRLWHLRGLDRLYRSGFAGLMEALDSFETDWLGKGEVAEQLTKLGIPPTSYGTRWYLTLFNYSIPFAAQLRVWDVFILLGDSGELPATTSHPATSSRNKPSTGDSTDSIQDSQQAPPSPPFGKSLDVLHATSAALIDGMRDIILESDFENAMKVLTSWVPVNDIDLFMRVARAEWKVHCRKKAIS